MNELTNGKPVSLPYIARFGSKRFELIETTGLALSGAYLDDKTHNRFEVRVEYETGTVEWFSVLASQPYSGDTVDFAGQNCSFNVALSDNYRSVSFEFKGAPSLNFVLTADISPKKLAENIYEVQSNVILFDVSDLVYYIGHHDNLTGIQRVQACVLLGLIQSCPEQRRGYLTFDNQKGDFLVIDPAYFEALLIDLSIPVSARKVDFDRMDARLGILPNTKSITHALPSEHSDRLVIYLLGAAWVNRDYFHRILDLKRAHDAYFCMTIHDLIPIFARETCDQGTANVFEEFLRKSFLFTDHYFTVSEYTAMDLHRFASSLGRHNVPISVVENGHAFDEFFPFQGRRVRAPVNSEYVLFVSTIEGRKNHTYIFDVWAKLAKSIKSLPLLVCVGRFGWRAEQFLEKMLVSNNLNNKIRVMSEVSDAQLEALYENCLFTIYPSIYEGWGLPVGESLSKGKLCVMSDKSSIPEVAREFGLYIDIGSVDDGSEKVKRLIEDVAYRGELEANLRANFKPRTWKKVADELVAHIAKLPRAKVPTFPTARLGREYKLAQLPPRSLSALGYAMISEVEGARKATITGYINRDEDLLVAQSMRFGQGWCAPEDWGAWSRFPECDKLFFLQPDAPIAEIVVYEKLRVVGPLVGYTLRVVINDGAPQEFYIDEERFLIRITGPIRLGYDGAAEVRIHYELKGPADVIETLDKIDGRRLGIGFESTLIVDETDLNARIAMLERILFGGMVGRVLSQNSTSLTRSIGSASSRPGKSRGRSLLVRSQAGLSLVDGGDQPSLSAPLMEMGETVPLRREGTTQDGATVERLLGRGWFPLEAAGVWSKGHESTLHFRLPQDAESTFLLSLEMRCLANRSRPVTVTVVVNNIVLGQERFEAGAFRTIRYVVDITISPENRAFVLMIHCDLPGSPDEVGTENDKRELGVQVRALQIERLPLLTFDHPYEAKEGSEITRSFCGGFYPMEASGGWSGEGGGRIIGVVDLPVAAGAQSISLSIVGRVFGTAMTGPAIVDLLVQGQTAASWTFETDVLATKTAFVPLLKLGDRSLLDLKIIRRGAISPQEFGGSADKRKLGLMISEIALAMVDLRDSGEEALALEL